MKKILAVSLSALMLFTTLTACKDETPTPTNTNKTTHEVSVVETTDMFIENGQTEYRIVLPDEADDYDEEAASTLVTYFAQATGVGMSKVKESKAEDDGKYIYIGDTEAAQDLGVTYTKDELTTQGFKIVTKDKSLYLLSAPGSIGKVWAAYEMLEHYIAWDCIAVDEVIFEETKNVTFKEMTIKEIPDVENRVAGNRQGYDDTQEARLFRFIRAYSEEGWALVNGRLYHNGFSYLPASAYNNKNKKNNYHPYWYSEPNITQEAQLQLCYTAHGDEEEYQAMLDASLKELIKSLKQYPTRDKIMFAMEDNTKWCTCETCVSEKEKYGSDAAVVIKFMNKLHEMLDAYFEEEGIDREVTIVFCAYQATSTVPVKDNGDGTYSPIDGLKCAKGVNVLVAPVYANFTESFYEESNKGYYTDLKKWGVISDEIFFWTYGTNYQNYLIPYGSFDGMQENVKVANEFRIKYMFEEGQHYAVTPRPTGFTNLKDYLASKWMWDYTADGEELTDKFFTHYFKDAAPAMRKYYEELRINWEHMYSVVGANGGIFQDVKDKRFWQEGMLLAWLGYIDEAYAAIEPLKLEDADTYKKLYDRIKQESIGVRYLYLDLYGDATNTADFEMMKEFKADLEAWGWGEGGQGAAISGLWISWGLA